jgi:ribosomal-protein-alanine N-acetyltransferase
MPPFNEIQITTPRLTLRPLRTSDAEAIFAIRSSAAVMRYGSHLPWTSMDAAREWVARTMSNMESNAIFELVLERTEDRAVIGSCVFFHLSTQSRCAEIGYDLNPNYWGKGYMHEALTAFLHFGFTELNFNRIEADVHPDNINSAKSLTRLGFIKEGHLRERWIVGDEVSDSIIYGLLSSEWKAPA